MDHGKQWCMEGYRCVLDDTCDARLFHTVGTDEGKSDEKENVLTILM